MLFAYRYFLSEINMPVYVAILKGSKVNPKIPSIAKLTSFSKVYLALPAEM